MKVFRAVPIVALAGNVFTVAADSYDASWRYSTMIVPKIAKAPTIDTCGITP